MILVTGGLGYIGAHTVVELSLAGHDVVIVDNLSNSQIDTLHKITQTIAYHEAKRLGQASDKKVGEVYFYKCDIGNQEDLENLVFSQHKIVAVIHFAAYKAVGESMLLPLKYYHNNVANTIKLLELVHKYQITTFVFSSSATVYGIPQSSPVRETFALNPVNTYGNSKMMVEQILSFWHQANPHTKVAILRYFNPVGANKSLLIGENPCDIPNNLMPYICEVALGKREYLQVFGDDYATKDGTGVRDYIHVVDLAKAHVMALEHLNANPIKQQKRNLPQAATHDVTHNSHQELNQGNVSQGNASSLAIAGHSNERFLVLNLGTGIGYSVLDVIDTFKQASGVNIPYRITNRRPGDIDCYFADPTLAARILGYQAQHTLYDMCLDSWNYVSSNAST